MASSPPPPPPPPHHRSDSSEDYYYFVVTVVVITIMLVVSNIIAFACCSPCRFFQNLGRIFRGHGSVSVNRSQELIPVSRYKKEKAYDTECSVCLTGFTEGEEVRQLPRCRHSFHAPCIDMWLYSHSSCPLCRAIVVGLPPPQQCSRAAAAREVSRQQSMMFTGSNNMGQMVVATM